MVTERTNFIIQLLCFYTNVKGSVLFAADSVVMKSLREFPFSKFVGRSMQLLSKIQTTAAPNWTTVVNEPSKVEPLLPINEVQHTGFRFWKPTLCHDDANWAQK